MIKASFQKIIEKTTLLFIFGAFLFLNYLVFLGENSVIAQSIGGGGGATSFLTTLIGGETQGISSDDIPLCCNGIKLEFSSIDSSNMYIVDEGTPVLWDWVDTLSYQNGNEFTEGYYTVGLLARGQCITIESECEETEDIPVIKVIGTGAQSAGGLGGLGGGL